MAVRRSAFAAIHSRLSEATNDPTERAQVAPEITIEAIAQFGDGGNDLGYRMIAAGLLLTTGAVDHERLGQAVHEKH